MTDPHREWYYHNIFNLSIQSASQFHIQGQNIGFSFWFPLHVFLSHWKKILFSQNTVMWNLVVDMNVMSSGYFRFNKTAQLKTLKSLFSPEVPGCSDIWQQVSGFMARGPGLTPSGIPTGRETEPIMQMWRPLTWKSMPVNGLDLHAPALLILIGRLRFIIIFGSREDNSCHVRADDVCLPVMVNLCGTEYVLFKRMSFQLSSCNKTKEVRLIYSYSTTNTLNCWSTGAGAHSIWAAPAQNCFKQQ